MKQKILFVCLGNICRSPLAEALFSKFADEHGISSVFQSDSCGTSGHHRGESPDKRTLKNAKKNNLEIVHLGRQLHPDDFRRSAMILTMDAQNYRDTVSLANRHASEICDIRMLRSFDPLADSHNLDVPDPWFGGEDGFEEVFQIISRSCAGLVEALKKSYPDLPH